jgi:hypothetical protein
MRDRKEIYNWHRIDERLTTSGQPSEAKLRAIRDISVCAINLGLLANEKALSHEACLVVVLGMSCIHLAAEKV